MIYFIAISDFRDASACLKMFVMLLYAGRCPQIITWYAFAVTTPPRGRLYSLSGPETKAMEEYIEESLATGAVRPSASPAGAGFFFVEKKDKTLRPCIDYYKTTLL